MIFTSHNIVTAGFVATFVAFSIYWFVTRSKAIKKVLFYWSFMLMARAWGYAKGYLNAPPTIVQVLNICFIVLEVFAAYQVLVVLFSKEKRQDASSK